MKFQIKNLKSHKKSAAKIKIEEILRKSIVFFSEEPLQGTIQIHSSTKNLFEDVIKIYVEKSTMMSFFE